MAVKRTLFDEPHHQSLELLATQALADGNIATAFKFADRRCRILPVPEPHCFVLRSEALCRMGAKAAAIADLATALGIAPDDISANRRMLAWAHGQQQRQAALVLVVHERNHAVLRKAIQILQRDGQENITNVAITEQSIEGWAVWQDGTPLEITMSKGAQVIREICEPDPRHPLGNCGHATSFCIRRIKSAVPQAIELSVSGKSFHSIRIAGNESVAKLPVRYTRPRNADDLQVTVIVPIFSDYDATRLCLESLLREINWTGHRAILINDATLDPQIVAYLAELDSEPHVEVLTNTYNLGFVGSVNRAFNRGIQDDIIILNSDTVAPPGFISRLAAAARSSSDIGTVTPLSNNGEFTSFPIPNISNPLGPREEVERIDRIAAEVNAGIVIDIPTGIGFCLYITRSCLNAFGPLSEDFSPGYLEDANFCLRAHEGGFRSVCAPSIYVGHAGSKSFGLKKRALVVRNLGLLERQFPSHRLECAKFMAIDPLRPARAAIERRAAAIACHPRLLVTGTNAINACAHRRARELGSDRAPAIILEVRVEDVGPVVKIINSAGGMPQSLAFSFAIADEYESLVSFIKSIEPSRIEFLDPANTPFQLVDMLLSLKIPHDLFIADAALAGPQYEHIVASDVLASKQYEIEKYAKASFDNAITQEDWTARWQSIAEDAHSILVPSSQAEAFAANVLPPRIFGKVKRTFESRHRTMRKRRLAGACHLGFVPVRSCASEQRLISETARQLGRIRPDISMTIIGATHNDLDLMRAGNVFVTGLVDPAEFEKLVAALGVEYLFVSITQPLFAHPALEVAFSSNLPSAYFDWSMGRAKAKDMDLAMDPQLPLEGIVNALSGWMPETYRGSSKLICGRDARSGA